MAPLYQNPATPSQDTYTGISLPHCTPRASPVSCPLLHRKHLFPLPTHTSPFTPRYWQAVTCHHPPAPLSLPSPLTCCPSTAEGHALLPPLTLEGRRGSTQPR